MGTEGILFVVGDRHYKNAIDDIAKNELIMKHFGKKNCYALPHYEDDQTKDLNNCIVLCDEPMDEEVVKILNAEVISYDDALAQAQQGQQQAERV